MQKDKSNTQSKNVKVPLYLDVFGKALDTAPNFLKKFGNLESKLLEFDIEPLNITKPVFITGLARSGSTILLEYLNDHPNVGSYQYRDYPFVHVNYFWNTIRKLIPSSPKKVERSHQDGIFINAKSPEAMDEIIWKSFIDNLHTPESSNILDSTYTNKKFEDFYKKSLLKLMFLRKTDRLALKNNYYISRLEYLNKTFPDAHFIIPIRSPIEHVYSLLKQHKLITKAQKEDPRGLRYMQRFGHFEFGLDTRPVNFDQDISEINKALEQSNMIEYFSHVWAQTYKHAHDTLQNNPSLKGKCLIVHYDELCENSQIQLTKISEFCGLQNNKHTQKWANKIKKPTYYDINLSDAERTLITKITKETKKLFLDN